MTQGNSRALHSSRRLKGYTDSDDRISNLPDSIIENILSFLPTKNAVATGFLSQRWKFLWTTSINLDFVYPDRHTNSEFKNKFVQFVNYVLLLHKPGCLKKFSLEWRHQCVPFYVNAWISAALTKNVHQLSVFVEDCDLQIQMQKSLFTCEGLQSLELNNKILWSSEIVVYLPKLESLKLISVYFQCEETFSKLLAGCPLLKYLKIHMDIDAMYYYFDEEIDTDIIRSKVPKSMFNCEGLQSLELDCNICISSEMVFSLPKLESLKLISVYFGCKEALCKLLAGCPVLEYLYIDTDFLDYIGSADDGNVINFIVSSASLRHFELHVYDDCDGRQGVSLCSVELVAPSLVYIKLLDRVSSIFIRESLSSLVEAEINLVALESKPEHDYCNLAVEAVGAFDCAEILTLSSRTIQALSCATINLKTRFKRLLELKVTIDRCCWSSLQEFIKLADNLKVLTVKKESNYENEANCVNKDRHNNSNWKNLNQVPGCLSNSLQTVSIGSYDGGDDELAMVGYLLEHGNGLKVVKIDLSGSSIDLIRKFKLVQQISKLPMKSTVCDVQFC